MDSNQCGLVTAWAMHASSRRAAGVSAPTRKRLASDPLDIVARIVAAEELLRSAEHEDGQGALLSFRAFQARKVDIDGFERLDVHDEVRSPEEFLIEGNRPLADLAERSGVGGDPIGNVLARADLELADDNVADCDMAEARCGQHEEWNLLGIDVRADMQPSGLTGPA